MCLNLSYLEPSDIEEELQQGKNRDVQIQIMSFITLGWVKKLSPDETSYKEAVYSNSDHLWKQDKEQGSQHPRSTGFKISLLYVGLDECKND